VVGPGEPCGEEVVMYLVVVNCNLQELWLATFI